MKRSACLLATLGGAAVLAATAAAAPKSVQVLIRHQTHGCHAWSVAGGAFRASQTVHLGRGGTITIVNNDVMPQALVEKSGPKVRLTGNAKLNMLGARVTVTFPKAGKYRFSTKAGEDYPGMDRPTVGKDNNLTLTVIVS
jgi:plastocyanin